MRFLSSIVYAFLLLGTIASAWSWTNYAAALGNGLLDKRDDSTTSSSASTSEQTTSVASQTSTESSSDSTTASDTKTASDQTSTGTNTHSNSKSKTTSTSSVSINPAAGAGGISMITPDSTSTTYYSVGQNITFVWNYTSLTVSPSAVDVIASCSSNHATYTVTQNMSIKATQTLVWDTAEFENASDTAPFLTSTYTLFVYDADKSFSDTASAGHLGSNIGYSFGMYWHQPATVLSSFTCVTCNGGLSQIQRQGLTFALGMAGITVLSFTWFANTFGLFSL